MGTKYGYNENKAVIYVSEALTMRCIPNEQLTVIRYINGERIESKDMSDYTVECDAITAAINTVNRRITTNDKK